MPSCYFTFLGGESWRQNERLFPIFDIKIRKNFPKISWIPSYIRSRFLDWYPVHVQIHMHEYYSPLPNEILNYFPIMTLLPSKSYLIARFHIFITVNLAKIAIISKIKRKPDYRKLYVSKNVETSLIKLHYNERLKSAKCKKKL